MILIFGGTTEGRKAAEVLEQAGKPYYYSTKTGEQELSLQYGLCIDGAMDEAAMELFCREHQIRLLIDAAHPFAERLHATIAAVAAASQLPIVRYDRIYPPHESDIHWCRDYDDAMRQLEAAGIDRLLMLTGVQTIARLKPFWQHHDCWCRILDRDSSRALAAKNGFPEKKLVYYEHSDIPTLLAQLRPQAIITKESGLSGGFKEKVEAAREAGVEIFVVERPKPLYNSPRGGEDWPLSRPLSNSPRGGEDSLSSSRNDVIGFAALPPTGGAGRGASFSIVTGPLGLRRAVEQHVPGFFPLKSGLTTGTCATAAVKAALLSLMGDEEESVWVQLPDGESVLVDIDEVGHGWAAVVKDFSDDPDVTRGCRIKAEVALKTPDSLKPPFPLKTPSPLPLKGEGGHHQEEKTFASHSTLPLEGERGGGLGLEGAIRFLQGEGVGRVTLPGLGIPVGEPAINPTPRRMIEAEVRALTDAAVDITISVEGGRELAKRTFNERVGVVDGISIIGTSGIVMPLSNEAFVESIGRELQVARAMGCDAIGLASGKRGEEALLAAEPDLRVVHYGNFIGAALERAYAMGFRRAVLGIMIGKAVKLAEGHLDTHSHKVLMNKTFLADVARQAGVADAEERLDGITMARELWALMPATFFERLQELCLSHCRRAFPAGQLDVRIIKG